ncbi:hypothetical protein MVS59_003917 [Salmonella enterica]|nr:hypothetical protein [Salmonella enterica]EJA5702822.1 hypothetical protein [Salmonella enterica]EJA5764234.1 hypothetical protein [Salmonella enterica]EJB8840714.1 hypothetical protein [Salmonella enterica]EJB8931046.1 hypothetical protein [Salmonella enterica]
MNTLIKNVPIAKVGKVFDGREITRHMLERCRDTFNPNYYQPSVGEFSDDPMVSVAVRNQGKVLSLTMDNDTLLADIAMFMSPKAVRKIKLYPTIAYMEGGNSKTPALIDVILAEIPNRDDNIMIKDCDISEAN